MGQKINAEQISSSTHTPIVTLSNGTNTISGLPFTPTSIDAKLLDTHVSDTYAAYGSAGKNSDGNIVQGGMGNMRNSSGTKGKTISSATAMIAACYWANKRINNDCRGTVTSMADNTGVINCQNITHTTSTWILTFSK